MVFKDLEMLAEAYNTVAVESKKEKPDYMDVDKDGNKKESMKKALADKAKKGSDKEESEEKKKKPTFLKKEGLTFKDLFNRVISEEYNMNGAFHDESESNPKLKEDREKLKKMRKEKEEAKKKKAKE